MYRMKFLLAFCCYMHLSENVQNSYDILPERCDVIFNKSFIYNSSYNCYKVSRNVMYLNMSFVLNRSFYYDRDAMVMVTGYQFRSNEYRTGPIRFSMPLCSALEHKDFDIPNMLKNANTRCPLLEGKSYYINKLRPDASNLPPFVPEGRWKLELEFLSQNKDRTILVNYYASIVYRVKFNF